jgi:hypothetical protein
LEERPRILPGLALQGDAMKNQQIVKKLALHKESIRLLENEDLKEAAGGYTTGDSLCHAKTCKC